MAYSRKDKKGRVLRKGETQRKCDGKYVYTYTDTLGRRRSIYSKDIKTLREREEQLIKDQLDGLDTYVAGSATVNFVFDNENFSVCFFQLLVVRRAITLLSILSMDSSEI